MNSRYSCSRFMDASFVIVLEVKHHTDGRDDERSSAVDHRDRDYRYPGH